MTGAGSGLQGGQERAQASQALGRGEAGEGDAGKVGRDRGGDALAAVGGDSGQVQEDGALGRPGPLEDVGGKESGQALQPGVEAERRDGVGHVRGLRAKPGRW